MMFKKAALFLPLLFIGTLSHAQTADQIFDQYVDFNMARLKNESNKALLIGESILPNVAKLSAKSQITYYAGLGKLYEDNAQPEKAIYYYEIVAKGEPDYYVVHRGLGYLYLNAGNDVYKKMQSAKSPAEREKIFAEYKTAILKALPHLEKAQACDPSDETLAIIKQLYGNIKDNAGLNSLNARLIVLSKNCLSVLSE